MNSNLIALLVENHAALTAETRRHPTAPCSIPALSERDLGMLESNIEVIQNDVASSLQDLSQLVSNYPSHIGDEDELLPKIGRMVGMLGDLLDVANKSATDVANGLWQHEQIRLASPELPDDLKR